MKIRIQRQDKEELFCYLALLCFVTPEGLRFNNILNVLWDGITILKVIVFSYLFITVLRRNIRNASKEILIIIFLEGVILISTYINSNALNEYLTWINTAINIWGIVFLFNWSEKKHSIFLVEKIYKYVELMVCFNLILAIMIPEGLGKSSLSNNWGTYTVHTIHLLGFKNNWLIWILVYIFLSEINVLLLKKKRGIAPLIGIFSAFYCKSSTAILVISIYIVIILLSKVKEIKRVLYKISPVIVISLSLGMNVLIVFFRIQYIFSVLIEKILHKTLTFTSRTYIWEQAISMVLKSPIWGYGNGTNGKFLNIAGYNVPAHNLYLDIILQGGIICGGMFLLFFIFSCRQTRELKIEIRFSILIAILLMMVAGLMESYFSKALFFIPFLISIYLKRKM